MYEPLNPQPMHSEIITLERYYATSKQDNDYRKRISWIADSSLPKISVYEYKGKQPRAASHGNSGNLDRIYVRTPATTMRAIAKAT